MSVLSGLVFVAAGCGALALVVAVAVYAIVYRVVLIALGLRLGGLARQVG